MEGDNNPNNPIDEAEAVPITVEEPRAEDAAQDDDVAAVVSAAQTQAKDFFSAPPSLDERGSQTQDSLDQRSAPGSLAADSGPGFAVIDGDVGGSGHNETYVDVIAVPCPGADPVQTWTYGHEYWGDTSISYDVGSRGSLRRPSPWVTRDLRNSVSIARVLLYRHRALEDGMTLQSLSKDLLDQAQQIRNGDQSRPLFFIGHSIGGLVIKSALVKAHDATEYQAIADNCHGVTFFGTPHMGSSYMSMPTLKESIRDLLHLQSVLPRSLTDEINVRNQALIKLHGQFVDMASEFRLWSFYETQESMLSGSTAGFTREVQFGAPLVSVKSALLEVWQEDFYAVDTDHAHLASFGPDNTGILFSYLADLAQAIEKAKDLSIAYAHTPLRMELQVKVEIIGFYDDPEAVALSPRQYSALNAGAEPGSVIRLYSTKYPYEDFLRKGPDRCLAERLHKGTKRPSSRRRADGQPRTEPTTKEDKKETRESNPSGLPVSASDPSQIIAPPLPPEIVITGPLERPPLLRSPVQSEPTIRPPSPESNASVSTTMSDPALPFPSDLIGDESHSIDMLAKKQAKILMKEHDLTITAGFLRPNASLRKFMWIHTPFNNPVWVKEIFAKLATTQALDFSRLFDYENWESKQIQNRNSDSQPAYFKAMCKYISTVDRLTSPRIPSPLFEHVSLGITPNCLFLYLPYLHFDTYHSMIRRRNLIAKRRAHGRAKPVPRKIAEHDSCEVRMIWEYIGFDPPLNSRRTLDQFGHHSLRDTNARDDDQMLYKLTKKDGPAPRGHKADNKSAYSLDGRSVPSDGKFAFSLHGNAEAEFEIEPDPNIKNGHVLMVDQLWLWSIDMTTLVTFFPKRESSPTEGTLFQQADLRNSIYNELNGDLTGRTENTLDLAALIVWHAVTVLIEGSSHPDLEIFRVFDEAIGMLAERMTLNMKRFRMHALDLDGDDDEDDSDDSDTEGESPAAIKKRHRREIERSERENRENTSALLELRDLEDELTTLQRLFEMQESTIVQMEEIYQREELQGATTNGQYYLQDAREYLTDYRQQTTEMLQRVNTTRNDYEKMLELVQRQAQVDEVRWSRLQAELASSQNLSVMIFTTFTVIFLPLTFFTGLFGMNTIEWQEENVPSLSEIGAISLPASFLLIILSLVAAFSWRVQSAFKVTYRAAKGAWKGVRELYADHLEPESRKRAKERRKEEKKRRQREAQMAQDDQSYDFWEMVKKQQGAGGGGYRIPDQNRNGAVPGGGLSKRKRE